GAEEFRRRLESVGVLRKAARAVSRRRRHRSAAAEDARWKARTHRRPSRPAGLVRGARSPRAARSNIPRLVEGPAMSARDDILGTIRAQRVRGTDRPAQYVPPAPPADLVTTFAERAAA